MEKIYNIKEEDDFFELYSIGSLPIGKISKPFKIFIIPLLIILVGFLSISEPDKILKFVIIIPILIVALFL